MEALLAVSHKAARVLKHNVYTPCSELRVDFGNDVETGTGLAPWDPGRLGSRPDTPDPTWSH